MYVGQDGKVHANVHGARSQIVSPSVVNDSKWHHLALVVGSSSQTLFVDGASVGTASGGIVAGGMAYTLMGVGYTTTSGSTVWPSTPGGWFFYNGLLDDARVYNRALSSAEVAALAMPPGLGGPLAWWKFDEIGGTAAADSSDHGKDAKVAGGTWLPAGGHIGGALSFDGSSTVVTLPDGLVNSPAYWTLTFASWIKTTGAGVLIEYQNGPYPTANNETLRYWPTMYIGTDGKLYGYVDLGGWVGYMGSSQPVNDGNWHHVALVVGPTTLTLYVGGTPVASESPGFSWGCAAPCVGGILWQDGELNNQLGAGYSMPANLPNLPAWPSAPGWFYYSGLMDDARFYGRDLSAPEIAQLAAQ
jgi:hypothetical protein